MDNATLREAKAAMRRKARHERQSVGAPTEKSLAILRTLQALPAFSEARVVMTYVAMAEEVQTAPLIDHLLASTRTVVVPYCQRLDIGLFRLEGWDELAPGRFGILEPRAEPRARSDKRPLAVELDLVVVPGLAFDPQGHRLGQGRGYYDRLLATLRPSTLKVGLAYQCQIVPEVPTGPQDRSMDLVITEETVYGV